MNVQGIHLPGALDCENGATVLDKSDWEMLFRRLLLEGQRTVATAIASFRAVAATKAFFCRPTTAQADALRIQMIAAAIEIVNWVPSSAIRVVS